MGFTGALRFLYLLIITSGSLYSTYALAQCEFSGLASDYSLTDAPVSLSPSEPGGTFSGPGVAGSIFDPADAGVGTHTVTYSNTLNYTLERGGDFDPVTSDDGWQPVPSSDGGNLKEEDDELSVPIDIGFDFQFFGVEYRRLYVSSHGEVLFTPYDADDWSETQFPSAQAPNNVIALARRDYEADSPIKSEINYRVDGSAPNRVFLLDFWFFDPRSPNADGYGEEPEIVTQLKLVERSNRIEIHTTKNTADEEPTLQGIENRSGSFAYFVPGRNNDVWTASDDFVAFSGCSYSQTVTVSGAYTIGGRVSGLAEGNELVLLNITEELLVRDNGEFTLEDSADSGSFYDVTIRSQPDSPAQNCVVRNGSGTVRNASVTDIRVACETDTHILSYSAGENGSLIGETEQSVADGEDGSAVLAEPDTGFSFSGWSDGSVQNPRVDTEVRGDINVIARFEQEQAEDEEVPGDDEDEPDRHAPVFGSLPPIDVSATGLLTAVSDVTAPTAEDNVDGVITATLITEQTLFPPGKHELVWSAEDRAGNQAQAVQQLNVHPQISLALDREYAEGGQMDVRFFLNGAAPNYPLAVGYTVAGTAGAEDHDLAPGVVTFNQGEVEQKITVNLTQDDISDAGETLTIAIDPARTDSVAANFGVKQEHSLTIVEKNLPPRVELTFFQAEKQVRTLTKDGGPGSAVVSIKDPNPGDSHRLRWVLPAEIAPGTESDIGEGQKRVTFDPSQLEPGVYQVEVIVTEEGAAPLSVNAKKAFRVAQSHPALKSSADADSDGMDDATEGPGDADGDGQADYLDPHRQANVISQAAQDGLGFLIESNPSTRLELGDYALKNADGAAISPMVVDASNTEEVSEEGTYVDFQVRNLPPGATAQIVIPQRQPIPEGAKYMKFSDSVWTLLTEDADNGVASTAGLEGACPPPGSGAYEAGLRPGDWCIQVTMNDGGPNDADGEANGVIRDPGGVSAVDESRYKTAGGAGSVGLGALGFLLLGVVGGLCNRRDQRKRRGLPKYRGAAASLAIAGALALMVNPSPVNAQELITGLDPLYVSGSLGYATTGADAGSTDQRFADNGFSANTLSIDGERLSWSLGLGYRATARVALEAHYVNLGDVNLRFETMTPGSDIGELHPESGHGVTFAGVYRHPLTQRIGASARLGAFVWEGDYETYQNGALVTESRGRSTDAFYALGLDYILSPEWSVSVEGRRFEFPNDPTNVLSIGLQLRFLELLIAY
jgi:hypothetical protein